MPNLALKKAGYLHVVQSLSQHTFGAGEAVTAGQVARIDTTSGKPTLANGTVAAEARAFGVCASPTASNVGVTLIRRGILDGYDLSALDFDAPIYLSDTDGALSTTAGTVSVIAGRVISGFAALPGQGPSKLLWLEINS